MKPIVVWLAPLRFCDKLRIQGDPVGQLPEYEEAVSDIEGILEGYLTSHVRSPS